MTWKDEIVEEIRNLRENHAKAFNYDIEAIGKALMEDEKKSQGPFVEPPMPQKAETK